MVDYLLKNKKKKATKCKNCHHEKKWHSYEKPHECNMVINMSGYQDKHWEAGYCTCRKFVKEDKGEK